MKKHTFLNFFHDFFETLLNCDFSIVFKKKKNSELILYQLKWQGDYFKISDKLCEEAVVTLISRSIDILCKLSLAVWLPIELCIKTKKKNIRRNKVHERWQLNGIILNEGMVRENELRTPTIHLFKKIFPGLFINKNLHGN